MMKKRTHDAPDTSESDDATVQEMMSKPTRMGRSAENDLTPTRIEGIIIGHLRGIDENGMGEVIYPGSLEKERLKAQSTVPVTEQHLGKAVALSFINNDPSRPIILGFMQAPSITTEDEVPTVNVTQDEQRLTLTAEKEIELKCGKSSITLTRAGKIIIKGAYVSTHSTGVNRLKGGSIQLN